jgi:hypothetical protein
VADGRDLMNVSDNGAYVMAIRDSSATIVRT